MEFVRVMDKSELLANQMRMVVVDGKEVLLANVDGSYHAIANKCPHSGGSLAHGALEGSTVRCPKHGARFDLKTGKAVGGAKIAFMKMQVQDTESYAVKIDGTNTMVGIP